MADTSSMSDVNINGAAIPRSARIANVLVSSLNASVKVPIIPIVFVGFPMLAMIAIM